MAPWCERCTLRVSLQEPGQQARNYAERLKYGRFFYRFPDGESAADVYDRMNMCVARRQQCTSSAPGHMPP